MTQTHLGETERRGQAGRGEFLVSSNGVGMRFEGLILHAFGFFFFFVQLTNMTCLTV